MQVSDEHDIEQETELKMLLFKRKHSIHTPDKLRKQAKFHAKMDYYRSKIKHDRKIRNYSTIIKESNYDKNIKNIIDRDEVQFLISELSQKQKLVIDLFLDGLSYEDIATELNIPYTTAAHVFYASVTSIQRRLGLEQTYAC